MLFKRSEVRYGRTREPTTPYQRAAQAWDERIGSARVQARNWRLMAFGSLFLSGGLAAALVWTSATGRIVTWVVQVDRLGSAQAVARPQTPTTSRRTRRSPSPWRGLSRRSAASRRSDHPPAELAAGLRLYLVRISRLRKREESEAITPMSRRPLPARPAVWA